MTDQPSNQPPADVPGWTPPTPTPPVTVKKPIWQRPWFLIVAAIVVIGILGNAFAGKPGTQAIPAAETTPSTSSSPPAAEPTPTPTETEEEEPAPTAPTKNDFKLKMKITKKQCFGSAGCNVSIKVDVAYIGAGEVADLPSNVSITFDVKGGEDGVYTSTIDLEDGKYSPDTTLISTTSSRSKLTAKITDVESY